MKSYWWVLLFSITAIAAEAQADSAAYFQQTGDEAFKSRRWLVAYQQYQQSLKFNDKNTSVYRNAGLAAVEMRKYDDATKLFNKVLEVEKNDSISILQMVALQFASRKWNEAVLWAKKAQQMHIGNNNHYIIAKSYYELENYGQAVEFLELAYRDNKNNAEVPYVAGRCFIEMSNYKRAAGCFEQALVLDSSRANWMYEAGLTYYAIPDDKKALYWFERAGAKGLPRSSDYLDNLGNAYISTGNFEKGITVLEELLHKKPQDMEVLYSVGEAYYKGKQYQKAIDTWDRILVLDNKNARSLYMIGMAYQKNGQEEKGRLLCDKAIGLDPSLSSLKKEVGGMGM